MPSFEIIYSSDPTSRALASETITARHRTEAAAKALIGFKNAQSKHGAKCFRIVDAQGMVVTRGPAGQPTGQ